MAIHDHALLCVTECWLYDIYLYIYTYIFELMLIGSHVYFWSCPVVHAAKGQTPTHIYMSMINILKLKLLVHTVYMQAWSLLSCQLLCGWIHGLFTMGTSGAKGCMIQDGLIGVLTGFSIFCQVYWSFCLCLYLLIAFQCTPAHCLVAQDLYWGKGSIMDWLHWPRQADLCEQPLWAIWPEKQVYHCKWCFYMDQPCIFWWCWWCRYGWARDYTWSCFLQQYWLKLTWLSEVNLYSLKATINIALGDHIYLFQVFF